MAGGAESAERRLQEVTELWLISAPGDKTCQQTWEMLNNITAKQHNVSTNFKFHIPDLKVGGLKLLVSCVLL